MTSQTDKSNENDKAAAVPEGDEDSKQRARDMLIGAVFMLAAVACRLFPV